jgi:hypothetical protein
MPSPKDIFGPRAGEVFDFSGQEWAKALARLQGLEELRETQRDEWGNWDGQFAPNPSELLSPSIDLNNCKNQVPVWPNGKRFAICLTHDIDTLEPYSWNEYSTRISRSGLLEKPRLIAGYVKNKLRLQSKVWDFSNWINCERSRGFKSTWFVFPDDPKPWARFDCVYRWDHKVSWTTEESISLGEALRRLNSSGNEVGLHASFLSAQNASMLRAQKDELETLIGQPVLSIRQHYLRFDMDQTPAAQESAGFQVDSTVGMNRKAGFRSGTCFPYFLWNHSQNRPSSVLEIPLVLQEGALFGDDALGLSQDQARKSALELLEKVEAVGGVLNILFHPDSQSDPRKWELYEFLLDEAARRNAWGPTVSELGEFWLKLP